MVAWSLLGRLPLGMTPIALLFLVRGEGHGYGAAGIVVALHAVAVGIGAPIADDTSTGPARPRSCACARSPTPRSSGRWSFSLCWTRASSPSARLRPSPDWRSRPSRRRYGSCGRGSHRAAFARAPTLLEAALQEVFFVGGPLLAAGLAAVEPAAAVAAAGIASRVGTSATARPRPYERLRPPRATGAGLLGALGSPGSGPSCSTRLRSASGSARSSLAMPAFAEEYGARELGGIALACFSAGSSWRPRPGCVRRAATCAGSSGVGRAAAALLGLQLAVSMPTLYVLSFLAGLPIAPTIGALYALIDRSAKAGTAAEAFAWFGTAVSIGIAIGSAAGGALVDERGVRWAFGFGAAVASAELSAWVRRGTLRALPPAGTEAEPASTLLTERP